MTGQLIFDLMNIKNFKSEDFYVNDNNIEASELVKLWPNWFNGAVVIFGPEKSGKSHLVNIWKEMNDAILYEENFNYIINNIRQACFAISITVGNCCCFCNLY